MTLFDFTPNKVAYLMQALAEKERELQEEKKKRKKETRSRAAYDGHHKNKKK